jgi:hypothetical protein
MKLSLLLVLLVLFTFICNISAKESEDLEYDQEDTLEKPSLEENDEEEEDEEEPKQQEEEEDEEFKNPNTLAKTEGKVQETKVAEKKVQETKVQNGETNMSFTA